MGEPPKSHRKARSPEAASADSHFPERTDQQTPPGSLVVNIFTHACTKCKAKFAIARNDLPTAPGSARQAPRTSRCERQIQLRKRLANPIDIAVRKHSSL